MHRYLHNVSGFYLQRDLAETTLKQLLRLGLRSQQLQIIAADSNGPPPSRAADRRMALLKSILRFGGIGAAAGIMLGGVVEIVLLGETRALGPWPLLSPAMLLGWSALGGALIGCNLALGAAPLWRSGANNTDNDVLLVVQTHNERETAIAHEAIKVSADLCKDTDMRADKTGSRNV